MKTKRQTKYGLILIIAVLIVGCAKTTVRNENEVGYSGLAKPDQINVYDFAVNPEDIKQNSGPLARLLRNSNAGAQTQEQMEIGREVADALANELTEGLRELGFNAVRSPANAPVPWNTILITGAFVNIDEGNKAKRSVVGLGFGKSSLDTQVSVLVPEPSGYRQLAGFDVHTDSGSLPGAAVMGPAGVAAGAGAAAVVATNVAAGTIKNYRSASAQQAKQQAEKIVSELSGFFMQQGWMSSEQGR